MNPKTTQPETATIRPAEVEDIPVLADLLLQLYAAELPGALTGPPAQQSRLMQFTLEVQATQALRNRFVLCKDNQVLGTGMIQFPTDPPFERAPSGTIAKAIKLVGYRSTGRLLLTVARSMVGIYTQKHPDAALLHSLVVNAQQRGQGLGRILLAALEQKIVEQGYSSALLQVLTSNEAAHRLYLQCGYQDIWTSPRWSALITWPSSVMRKALK